MIVCITGTPGTGKTTTAEVLEGRGYRTISLHDELERRGLLKEYDENSESYIIDTEELKKIRFQDDDAPIIIEGHLSHFLKADIVIVLRCNPRILKERLKERGYSTRKVLENLESEMIDITLVEALEVDNSVFEIDCTFKETEDVVDSIIDIINGETNAYDPGDIDWSGECMEWS